MGVTFCLAITLVCVFRVDMLCNDAAQYISTGRNIARGEGISTSLIYYEQQQGKGIPAPQTIWPPGFPFIIAIIGCIGVPFEYAAFLGSLLAQLATLVALLLLLKQMGCSPNWAISGVVLWAALVQGNLTVLMGLSESTYTVLTLLSMSCFLRGIEDRRRQRAYMLTAGIIAAAAFSVRYAGIAFIVALALYLMAQLGMTRDRAWGKVLLLFVVTPVCTVGAVFLRNIALVGSFSGGPTLHDGGKYYEEAKVLWWCFKNLLGYFEWHTLSILMTIWLCAGGAVLLALYLFDNNISWILTSCQKKSGNKASNRNEKKKPIEMVHFCGPGVFYVIATIIMLVNTDLTSGAGGIGPRYLVPVFPFVIGMAVLVSAKVSAVGSIARRRWVIMVASLTGVLYLIGQGLAFRTVSKWLTGPSYNRILVSALESKVGGGTLLSFLQERTNDGSAIMEANGQLLGMLLDRGSVGLAPAAYTRKSWDEKEVLSQVRQYKVSVICLFPTVFDMTHPQHRNREFIGRLAEGKLPVWLRPILETEVYRVYEVDVLKIRSLATFSWVNPDFPNEFLW